jgi:hypothetical protein
MTFHWREGDQIFERLVETTAPLSDERREAFLARLVLLLANEVDDADAVLAAIDAAGAADR